jgi:plastocyanin
MLNASKTTRSRSVLASLLAIPLTLANCGCGELVNGANLKVAVKYRPSTNEAPTGDASATPAAATEVATSEGVGILRGKVVYTGAFTPLAPLYEKGADVKDPAVCAAAAAPNESIEVKDGGLANAFIYLKKAPKGTSGAPAESSVIFDQKGCVFLPHALVVRVGQTVNVLNADSIAHNTHTNGKKNTSFNSIVSPNERMGVKLIYKQAEQDPISVVCDVHAWMKAYHLPIDHPYAAVSSENGTFEIKDLPAGKHEFKVWHESAGPSGGLLEKALVVTIKPGDNDLTINVSPSQLGK